MQIRPPQPKFLLCQSLPQTLQPSEFVIFIAKDIESSSPTPSSMPVRWQIISGLNRHPPRIGHGASQNGTLGQWICLGNITAVERRFRRARPSCLGGSNLFNVRRGERALGCGDGEQGGVELDEGGIYSGMIRVT